MKNTKPARVQKCTRNKILIVLMICLLAVTLTACGFFGNNKKEVKTVSISAESGLSAADGGSYTAQVGKEFTLKINLNSDAPSSVSVKWYMSVAGEERAQIIGHSNKEFKHGFSEYTDDVYEFSATVDGVESSNTIKLKVVYADLGEVSILSDKTSVGGIVQMDLDDISSVTLTAQWNMGSLDPHRECVAEWYVGQADQPAHEGMTFIYTPTANIGKTEIKLLINSEGQSASASIYIVVMSSFDYVERIDLAVTSGATWNTETKQAYQINQTSEKGEIHVAATAYPLDTTNLSAPVKWTLRDKDGEAVLNYTGRELHFTPKHGENVLTAEIENFESRTLTVIALTETEYVTQNHSQYIDDTYIWNGNVYNRYILDQHDLNVFVNYIISLGKKGSAYAYGMYLYPSEWRTVNGTSLPPAFYNENKTGAFNIAMKSCEDTGRFVLRASTSQITIDDDTVFGTPEQKYPATVNVEQYTNTIVHYGVSSGDERMALPIDLVDETMTVENSNALYRAVEWGYRPIFADTASSTATLYAKARAVLFDIIGASMSDYEKVRAIYEWIIMETDYDYGVAAASFDGDLVKYNAFYLEGVFNDGQAVCDGKAKAFSLLCGMEGIRAIRVTGDAITQASPEGTAHAWNKVLVDADGDGVREWYAVDTTWGDLGVTGIWPGVKNELLTMEYFLVSDAFIAATHSAISYRNPAATTEFDYYANTSITYMGDEIYLHIENNDQLNNLLAYCSTRLDIRLNITVSPSVAANQAALEAKMALYEPSCFSTAQLINAGTNNYVIYVKSGY